MCHGKGYWFNPLDTAIPCTFCEDTSTADDDFNPHVSRKVSEPLPSKSQLSIGMSESNSVLIQIFDNGLYTLLEVHSPDEISYSRRWSSGEADYGEVKLVSHVGNKKKRK